MADDIKPTIPNPENPDEQIPNPDYKAPEEKQAKQAPPAEKLDLTEPPPAEVTVGKTGNPAIDAVGDLLAERKVANADAIIAEFAKTGELSLSTQAKLVETLGDTTAGLVITQLTTEASKIKEASTKLRSETLDYMAKAFGETDPEGTWKAVQDFVKSPESGFTVEDKAELSRMLQKGGLAARLAIDNIVAVHTGNPNTTSHADLLQGDTLATRKFEPISAKSYSEQVGALVDKYGYESLEVRQLQQRRERSRNAGIA